MQNAKLLVICADATPDIGAGHVMRCLALAQAWRDDGGRVVFWGCVSIPWVLERIRTEGFPLRPRTEAFARLSPEEFGDGLTAILDQPAASSCGGAWAVLDSYAFTPGHHRRARDHARLLVVDDNNHLPSYEADILFNQNPAAGRIPYQGAIGEKCVGHRYILIRSEFRELGRQAEERPRKARAETVLVTLGGGEITPFLEDVVGLLAPLDLAGLTVRIVANDAGDEVLGRIRERVSGRLEFLDHVDNMAELLRDTDFCITAAGATCWELCYLGIPFVPLLIADNQADNLRFLEEEEIAFPREPLALQQALADTARFAGHVRRMTSLIDGRGAQRLCRAMGLSRPAGLSLRRAEGGDVRFVFDLVNDPLVRSTAFHPEPIAFDAHSAWFARFLESGDLFYIAEKDGSPCGYVRFEQADGALAITIAVQASARGSGVGLFLLSEGGARAAREFPGRVLRAYAKVDNLVSLRLFRSAGFEQVRRLSHLGAEVWLFERREGNQ